MLGRHFHVGAAVAHAHDASVHCREDGAEGGADHAAETAQARQGSGNQGSCGSGAYHSRDRVIVAQQAYGLDHRAFALEAYHVGRALVAAYDLRGVENLHAAAVVVLAFQAALQGGFVSAEYEMQVTQRLQGGDCAVHVGFRAVVAAEAINNNLYHTSFFTKARRLLWTCRPKRFQRF